MDLYANMTIDAGGWLNPRIAESGGKTAVGWVYGLNHPDAKGAEYWKKACSEKGRGWPRKSPSPNNSAGIAIDEWGPPKLPDNEKWLCEGLRAGRKENPDVFIAIWTTDPTPAILELGKDNTADLILVERYTHSAAEDGPATDVGVLSGGADDVESAGCGRVQGRRCGQWPQPGVQCAAGGGGCR